MFKNKESLLETLYDLLEGSYKESVEEAETAVADAQKTLEESKQSVKECASSLEIAKIEYEDFATLIKLVENQSAQKKDVPEIKKETESDVDARRKALEVMIRKNFKISARQLREKLGYGKGKDDYRFNQDIKYLRATFLGDFVTVKKNLSDNNPCYYFQKPEVIIDEELS